VKNNAIRVIDDFYPAEDGWCAVVAVENIVKIKQTKGWWIFKKTVEIEMDHVYLPVVFFANAYMHKEDNKGQEMRTSSFIMAMVRMGDGIEAAANLEGYIGLVSPSENSVDDVYGMREAVTNWRNSREEQKKLEREKARSMMN
jgi:hypothetical protein